MIDRITGRTFKTNKTVLIFFLGNCPNAKRPLVDGGRADDGKVANVKAPVI